MTINVSFSSRYQNIIKISKSLTLQGKDFSVAKLEAQQIEQHLLSVATTSEEYQLLCDEYIHKVVTTVSNENDVSLSEQDTLEEEVFNTQGPVMSNYEWCTFHADGVTSTIYKARIKSESQTEMTGAERTVALKVTRPDVMQPPHEVRKEARILRKLTSDAVQGRDIISLLETFQQPGGYFVMVFPFLRQDLENLLRSGRLNKKQSGLVFKGLFSGLAWIHKNGIIHRDIKPGNILLKSMDGPVYIIDFGISWAEGDPDSEPADQKITDVGTTCYRPPELLFGHRNYDTSLDIWAAGCVIAEMIRPSHYPIFDAGPAGTELGLIKSIFETLGTPTDMTWPGANAYPDWGKFKFRDFPGKPWDEILPHAGEMAVEFIKRSVCFEMAERMTAQEALDHRLADEWNLY